MKGCHLVLTDTVAVVGAWFDVACGFGTTDPRTGPWVPGLDGEAGFGNFTDFQSGVVEVRWDEALPTAQSFHLWITAANGGYLTSKDGTTAPLRIALSPNDMAALGDGAGAWLGVSGATARTAVEFRISLFEGDVPSGYTAFA